MLISRRSALLGTAAAVSFAAPVAVAEHLNRVADHEPLIDLWQEYRRRLEVHEGLLKKTRAASAADDHEGCRRLEHEAGQYDSEFVFEGIEHEICMADARTIEGAVIQARMLALYVDDGIMTNGQDADLARNLVTGLERLAGRPS